MNLTLLQDSTADQEPISVADAQGYLVLDPTLDQAQIQTMITAARLEAENENGRELSVKQWKLALDSFTPWGGVDHWMGWPTWDGRTYEFGCTRERITLLDPLVSVDAFTYKKADGTVVTLVENTDYIVDTLKHPGIVCPAPNTSWPGDDLWPSSAIEITFTAGMEPAACPSTIKQGMLLLVSQWYEGRLPFEAIRFVAELPFSVTSLFRNNKIWRF